MAKELFQVLTRVDAADRKWLESEAERTGLNLSSLVRSTIRRQRLASEAAAPAVTRQEVA